MNSYFEKDSHFNRIAGISGGNCSETVGRVAH